ncbi:uncharacterized protein LOC6497578 isoform X1 [Drosophila ananassae]|uniref:uncharacterized protein LOC6497578 isoform X1 n=1 Tax=Drosophila ananassae TaxID=7217 RepID=UPI001D00114F|nr:uncharacterized protein LOC6497578 isoform X1 [Drosophila ananassae]
MLYVRETKGGEPTESGYQTIDELTPNSADDFFTRTWLEQQQQQQQPPAPHQQSHKQHKSHLAYTNASVSSAMPWHPSAGGGGGGSGSGSGSGMIHRVYSATPPDFPPPRLNLLEHTVAPPEPPTILYNQTRQRPTATASDSITTTAIARATEPSLLLTTTAHHHAHHQQQQQQQQSQHTLNAFQLPLPPRPNQNLGQSEKYQTYAPHFVPPAVGGGPPSGSGEQTTISAATSTIAMSGLGAGAAGGGSVMMGAVNHMMMGGGQLLQPSQTLLPIKQDKLVPNYDNVEQQMKFYEIRTPLVLSCNVKSETTTPLIWKKNHTNVMEVDSLKGRYKIIEAERKFIIEKTDASDDGTYSCEIEGESKTFNVIAKVAVRVPSNTAVVEGEKMSITCVVVGTAPQLSWSFGNLTLTNSTGRYVLKEDNNVQNAILTLENVTLEDRGEYKCIGRNAANEYGTKIEIATDASTVRVKGKFAALWPFLGICAEVLILCVIILIYEKRRNKSELEESDTDPQEH